MKLYFISLLKPIAFSLVSIGIDLRLISNISNLGRYLRARRVWKKNGGFISRSAPILSDFKASAGSAKGHYFHQDLLVATMVHDSKPVRHVDIGSRVDGLVAHIASFRTIEVIDIRDLPNCGHDNIKFFKADLMNQKATSLVKADSISCLHVIEHFGLGRYGDPIDPEGHINGFRNICRMVVPDGRLYISFPIARVRQVVFNAHRVFEKLDIFDWFESDCQFTLLNFSYVDDSGALHKFVSIDEISIDSDYGCGIYTFVRN